MGANLNGFDANTVDPLVEFEAIPEGKYLAMIVESGMKDTKDKKGHFLEFKFEVVEGEHKGRNLWARLNLDNANPTAVQIAQAELSAICRAVGIMRPKDSVELHNLPILLTVKVKKREDNGNLTNEIKGYAKKEAAVSQAPGGQAGHQAAPWGRS